LRCKNQEPDRGLHYQFTLPADQALEKGVLAIDRPLFARDGNEAQLVILEKSTYVISHSTLDSVSIDGKTLNAHQQKYLAVELSQGWHSICLHKTTA
jgi:helix-turn-helix protein